MRSTEKNLVTSKKAFQVSVILNLFQDLDETLKHRGQFDVQGDVRRKLGKLCAFTLAEVLITLGVIGVVAAVTMPVLISNHRRSVTEARLAKFYSSMNQAVKRAELDYGDKSTWDKFTLSYEKDENGHNDISKPIPNTDYFNKYFKPYIVTTKIDYAANGEVLAYFPDGSMAGFSANSIHFYPNTKDYKASEFDTDSGKFKNDMENSGIKVFTFSTAASSGIEPYKSNWDGTKEMLLNDNNIGCKKEVTNERAYCTALIQMNGWKIPKDYPLRF